MIYSSKDYDNAISNLNRVSEEANKLEIENNNFKGELQSLYTEISKSLGPGKPPKGVTKAEYWIHRIATMASELEEYKAEAKKCEYAYLDKFRY